MTSSFDFEKFIEGKTVPVGVDIFNLGWYIPKRILIGFLRHLEKEGYEIVKLEGKE